MQKRLLRKAFKRVEKNVEQSSYDRNTTQLYLALDVAVTKLVKGKFKDWEIWHQWNERLASIVLLFVSNVIPICAYFVITSFILNKFMNFFYHHLWSAATNTSEQSGARLSSTVCNLSDAANDINLLQVIYNCIYLYKVHF